MVWRCPRGGQSCARRAAGRAPVGPPLGPPLGAVYRLKILFFYFFTNFFAKFRGINYGMQPVRCPRGGLLCARRAAGCAPVGPPVGPPLGAVFRLKIIFFSFFAHISENIRSTTLKFGMEVPQGWPVMRPSSGRMCARRAARRAARGAAPKGCF